ncbi:hypothetical protein Peur_043700 [Populus x canadensis]
MFCYFMLPSLGFLGCFQCSIEEGPIKNWQGPNPCSVLLSKSLYRHVVKYMCTYINIWFEARGVLVEDMTRGVKFMHQVYRCVRLPGLIGGRKGASTTID